MEETDLLRQPAWRVEMPKDEEVILLHTVQCTGIYLVETSSTGSLHISGYFKTDGNLKLNEIYIAYIYIYIGNLIIREWRFPPRLTQIHNYVVLICS